MVVVFDEFGANTHKKVTVGRYVLWEDMGSDGDLILIQKISTGLCLVSQLWVKSLS